MICYFFHIVRGWTIIHKHATILFCLALIAQLTLLTGLIAVNGVGRSVFLNSSEGDAEEHLLITERLLAHGGFYSGEITIDRKSTRLNSSHSSISYAVFFFKNKAREGYGHHTNGGGEVFMDRRQTN